MKETKNKLGSSPLVHGRKYSAENDSVENTATYWQTLSCTEKRKQRKAE